MRRTRDILMAELWTSVALVALIVVVFETGLAMPGMLAGQEHIELLVGMIMIIIVLTCIPLSLYLFRLKHVQARLIDDESSSAGHLLFWGTVRMMMLCVPMVVSMFLYYAFGLNVRFFYLAVICGLCLFMIYPTLGRCLRETGINEKAEDYDPNPDDDNPLSY